MFNLCNFDLFPSIKFSQGFIKVHNYTDLISQSKKFLFDGKERKRVEDIQKKYFKYFSILDGNCTKRNASEIMNYIR